MDREIQNKALREALQKAGLQDVLLIKGRGYFYLVGKEGTDPEEVKKELKKVLSIVDEVKLTFK